MIKDSYLKEISDLRVNDPEFGDVKLNVFPFINNGSWVVLPNEFKLWEKSINDMAKLIPVHYKMQHYVTIDSKFFSKKDCLRREGIHIDGNFCVDPEFSFRKDATVLSSWGGMRPTWAGMLPKENEFIEKEDNSHVDMDFCIPYNVVIPFGKYVSDRKGGILIASSLEGCEVWPGSYDLDIGDAGSIDNYRKLFHKSKSELLKSNKLYFMTSNIPHESLPILAGKRRTLIRITLNHDFDNSIFRSEDELAA